MIESNSKNQEFPTFEMLKYADLAKRIAWEILKVDIEVKFGEWNCELPAQYIDETLYLNLKVAPKVFFESLTSNLISLTIHELSRKFDKKSYDEICADVGAKLTMIALDNPAFFDMEMSRLR
ncbi:hypothetical protein KAU33_09050 [Candidatus Dependentiae bacterium]|nr:hypothetical protein [Candidatus Dependentiae bacterium]